MKKNFYFKIAYSFTIALLIAIANPAYSQNITVTAPNGSEEWEVGSSEDITWTSTGTSGTVHIEYSTNNGTNWTDVIASTSDIGTHSWTIPDDPSVNCLVRVSDTDGDPTDDGDAVFTISPIPFITVTAPNGSEELEVGSSRDITWTSSGTSGTVHIEYSTNNGTNWTDVIASTSDIGTYSWTIPDDPSVNCLVRVSDTDDDPTDDGDAVFTISPIPFITVTAPNGTEEWEVGSSKDITWTSSGTSGTVHIEYSTNNGTDWTDVIASTTDDGSHSWTIPDDVSSSCLVRVSDTDSDPTDDGNAVFAISPIPLITVTAPNGGEDWEVGSSEDITWTSSGTSGTVHIEYSTNSGTDWTDVIASTPDDGTHAWTIPDDPSENCLVRVSDTDGAPTDDGDAVFAISSIPFVSVTSPNGSEEWHVGAIEDISWTSSGTSGNVHIEYSTNNGTDWADVIVSTTDDGAYGWTVPDDISSNCLLRVSDTDGDPTDNSDAVFTISAMPFITVAAPNGGEEWVVSSIENITWTSANTSGNVKIDYSVNNGTDWTNVIASTPDDGTYEWTIPDDPSETCLIRVSDTDDDPTDNSDVVFTISPVPFITILTPIGGEEWHVSVIENITWESSGTSGNVHIEYSINNGTDWADIIISTPDDGIHPWTIPDDISENCLVRVSDTDDDPTDESDAVFIISAMPLITVSAPNGGEEWIIATLEDITWTSVNTSGNVHIEYSVNNGTDWADVIVSTPDDGLHEWTIPNNISENCLVRITDVDLEPTDESDVIFEIDPVPFVSLTSPRGGENMQVGSSQTISWTSSGTPGTMTLGFSSNNEQNWTYTYSIPDNGSYEWTVPNTPSTNCIISLCGSGWDPCDKTTAFTISAIPAIFVNSPEGGENWILGSVQTIEWNSLETSANVKIEYSSNGGTIWKEIIATTPDDGSYEWTIPADVSENCLVRISDADGDPVGTSEAVFTISPIPFVNISSPVGGESFQAGSTQTISWTSSGTPGTMTFGFSSNNEQNWTYAYSIPDNGSYEWTVPNTPSVNCIISLCGSGWDPCDKTEVFTITAIPEINVTSPNGGENWILGTSQNITWNSLETSGNVKIEHTANSGTTWTTIIANTPDDGIHEWTIPDNVSENCLIRISDAAGDPEGISEAIFSIAPVPFVSLVSPMGGENFQGGTTQLISWTSSGTKGTMNLGFSSDKEQNWTYIFDIPDTGSYEWTVPNSPSDTCVISLCGSGWDPCDKTTAFTVTPAPEIDISAPDGGEKWSIGSSQEITWNSFVTSGNVQIEYSTNSGITWSEITASTPDTGTYEWTVPDEISENCVVRISDLDGEPVGTSKEVFAITPAPFVSLSYPEGGQTLAAGSSQTITWTSFGTRGTVTLGFSSDSMEHWTITYGIPDIGSYEWVVPNTFSANCVIEVCGSGWDPCDKTAVFTIVEAPATSVSIVSVDQISVYPNPASNTINIAFNEAQESEILIKLMDIRGQVKLQSNYPYIDEFVSVNINDLTSGMYFLEVVTSNESQTFIIIKE